ncbi:acetyl esterase/lipase [Stackebrandtia albiflava]|uniref:Acetyl esterase/lipase n=1 Tax=Stackebrandtia albiflava TaxID=406432 RepID=A0A562V127_9ACTN|nr:alpha/beta hydrolase [Stackebrandtia albiflava]TWJ11588.1 acetyl esterase/lipase [Stackebrandtia albiflava]
MADSRDILTRPAAAGVTDVYGPDPDQVVEWFTPVSPPRATVAVVHGGFWRPEYDRAHLRPLCGALRDAGMRVAAVEYRRGVAPAVTAGDVAAAVGHVGEAVAGEPLLLLGHSAGGHLALYLEPRAAVPVAGVVALAPVTDMRDGWRRDLDGGAVAAFLGGSPEEVPDLYDEFTVAEPGSRAVVLHGDVDEWVPVEMSREYVARTGRTVLRELPGVGHFPPIDPESAVWPVLRETLDDLATGRPATH